MNSFFAVDPAAIKGSRDVGALLHMVTPGNGRFIYDFPRRWRDDVVRHLDDLPDVERKRIEVLLERGEVASLFPPPKCGRKYQKDRSWEWNAGQLRGDPMLVGTDSCKEPVRPLGAVISAPEELPPSGSAYVDMKAGALANAVWPLLMVSTKVVVTDPYLKVAVLQRDGGWGPSSQGCPVLKELLRSASQGKVEAFEVYASSKRGGGMEDDPTGNESKRVLERIQAELKLSPPIAIVCRPLETLVHPDFIDDHDRHILGNHCGISSGRGFSEHATHKTKLQWLAGPALNDLLDRFM